MFQNVCPSLSSDYEWSRWTDIHNTYTHNIHIHINVHKQYNKQHTYMMYIVQKNVSKCVSEFSAITIHYSTSHCITTHHIAHIYLSIDLYVKQDHHNLYAHSLSFIICFNYNRTENSDAHFGTFLMKTMQVPINNLHRKHRHQSSYLNGFPRLIVSTS